MKDKKRKRSIFESTANLAVTDSKICLYNRLEMGEGERVYLFITVLVFGFSQMLRHFLLLSTISIVLEICKCFRDQQIL